MPAVTAVVSALLARAVENHRKEQSNVATRCLNAWGRDGLRPRSVEHECQCRWHSGSGGLSLREQNSALADEFASSTSNPPPDYILRAQQVLNTRYGSGRFAVAAQTAPVGTVSGDRYNDSPPWWGGEQIFDPMSSEGCSDGFAVLDPNGDEAMMTADHCGPLYSYEFISSWQYTGGCYGPCQEEEVGQITLGVGPGWLEHMRVVRARMQRLRNDSDAGDNRRRTSRRLQWWAGLISEHRASRSGRYLPRQRH